MLDFKTFRENSEIQKFVALLTFGHFFVVYARAPDALRLTVFALGVRVFDTAVSIGAILTVATF